MTDPDLDALIAQAEQAMRDPATAASFRPVAFYDKDGGQLEVFWEYGAAIARNVAPGIDIMVSREDRNRVVGCAVWGIKQVIDSARLSDDGDERSYEIDHVIVSVGADGAVEVVRMLDNGFWEQEVLDVTDCPMDPRAMTNEEIGEFVLAGTHSDTTFSVIRHGKRRVVRFGEAVAYLPSRRSWIQWWILAAALAAMIVLAFLR